MIRTLKELARKAKASPDESPQEAHGVAMDLVESMLRHFAVVAMAAYRHAGARDKPLNQMIARQLPWPSMGSWKNFLQRLAKADKDLFPEGFAEKFLAPLGKTVNDAAVAAAYGRGRRLLEYASTQDEKLLDEGEGGEARCSPIEFFDLMVTYRNAFIGHGTQVMSRPMAEFAPLLAKAAVALCNHLRSPWLAFPVYAAEKGTRAGGEFYRLVPLTDEPGIEEVQTTDEGVVEGRLYVRTGKRSQESVSLYPVALWDKGDILFLNGAKDFRSIKYVGYALGDMMETDIHEKAFCEFILPFMGGKALDSTVLADARALAQAMDLKDSGWTFPHLKKGMEVGADGARHRLVKKLGRGGMAEVWRAVSLQDHGEAALKFLVDPVNAARFRREARVLERASKSCDRIVKYVDFQFDPHPARRVAFLVMELLPGDSLEDRARRPESYTYDDVLNWMEDALEGLKAVHGIGAIHRDIKPSNLMLDSNGRVKLGDLGLAGVTDESATDLLTTTGLTQDGTAMGTYEFSALEQLEGGASGTPVGPQSDLFSIGASFYHVISGEFPFGSGNVTAIGRRHMQAEADPAAGPKPLVELRKDCPEALGELVMALINVSPDLRPGDAETVLSAVKKVRQAMKGEQTNVNLNLLGRVETGNVEFHDLMPRWCSVFIFWVWPVVMALEWALVIPLSAWSGTWLQIDVARFGLDAAHYRKLHPFWKDYMFLAWNNLPFLLIWLLYRARRMVQPLMKTIHYKDNNKRGSHWSSSAKRNDFWAGFVRSKWLLAGIVLVASYACYIQFSKLGKLAAKGEIYWWDWKISPVAYVVRDVALFFQFIGLGLLMIIVVAMVDTISYVLRGTRLSVDLHHSDQANGLADVGRLLSLFLPFAVPLALHSVAGTIDHRGQDPQQVIADWVTLGLFSAVYFFLFFWPMVPVRRQIVRFIELEIDRFAGRRLQIEGKMRRFLDAHVDVGVEQADVFAALRKLSEEFQRSERQLTAAGTWPIRGRTAWLLAILGITPVAIAIVLVKLVP